jgi:hypothetical protein
VFEEVNSTRVEWTTEALAPGSYSLRISVKDAASPGAARQQAFGFEVR